MQYPKKSVKKNRGSLVALFLLHFHSPDPVCNAGPGTAHASELVRVKLVKNNIRFFRQ